MHRGTDESPALDVPGRRYRLLSAGGAAVRWLLAFGISFGVMAGVLILAHI
jgi:hypothetical protein